MSDGIYEKIRTAVIKTVDAGAHLNAAGAAESIGKSLGLSDGLVQYTHVELRNIAFENDFKKIPFEERALFLPHCSRHSANCKATFDEEGYHCLACGACNLDSAIKIAKKIGYKKIFIVPGGSLVKKLIEKYKPKAAIGVCCFNEAILSFELAKHGGIIAQAVLLLKDGCKDTMINLPLLEEKLSLIDESLVEKKKKKARKK